MGGRPWLSQFIYGFPLVGDLSQKFAYTPSSKRIGIDRPIEEIFEESSERFRGRPNKGSNKADNEIWNEGTEQKLRGLMGGPFDFNEDGPVRGEEKALHNIAFRFAVIQPENVRAIDDCKHARINEFCKIRTPISLPSWDHVAECTRMISSANREWGCAVADQHAAYKCEPLMPKHINLRIIAIWNPKSQRYFAFKPPTQLFGSADSVLNYNILSRILAPLANRVFAIPVLGYFGDFGFIVPWDVGNIALSTFEEFCAIAGIRMNSENPDFEI